MLTRMLLRASSLTLSLAAAPPACADGATVVMKNFDFAPMAISVPVGTTVTWKNLDGEPHTVVSADGLFRSRALDQNDTYTFKFTKPGIYKYVCSIHPKMMASVTVR